MTTSAVIERRSFTVNCARGVSEDCDPQRTLTREEHGISSRSQAEEQFREDGWRLHSDGKASCPPCIRAWEGE